jgi:hypothetical protein
VPSSSVTSLQTGASRCFHPAKNVNSMIKAYSNIVAPSCLTRSPVAFADPPTRQSYPSRGLPVAIKSSTTTTRSEEVRTCVCISKISAPYSLTYSACTVGPGSFPRFRTGTKRMFNRNARAGAKMKPRASRPMMTVGFSGRR